MTPERYDYCSFYRKSQLKKNLHYLILFYIELHDFRRVREDYGYVMSWLCVNGSMMLTKTLWHKIKFYYLYEPVGFVY